MVLTRTERIEVDDLPPDVRTGGAVAADGNSLTFAVGTRLDEIERRVIRATLAHTAGDKPSAGGENDGDVPVRAAPPMDAT